MELKVDNASIEKLVNEQIRVSVIEALKGKQEFLLGRLVDEALNAKRNSYDSRTILQNMLDEMIRKAATEAANEWLTEQRPKIKKLVHEALGKKASGLVSKVADALTARLGEGVNVSVWFGRDE
jgi:hypothetical protein